MKKSLSIKVISNACGVLPHTIRTWEKRYNVFNPDRTEGGQRLYGEDDLAKAKLIVALIDQGHSISNLANLSVDELKGMFVHDHSEEGAENPMLTSLGTKKILKHLEAYKIDMVASEMEHLRMSIGAKDFIFNIVLPVMREIGMLVAKGKYSVTQEHIISTIVRGQLGQITLPNIGPDDSRYALATPDGNLHELSILIADIICRANRVSTNYLGSSHPARCLGEAVTALKCRTIVMGVVSSDHWDYDKNMINYLQSLDKYLGLKVKVILGGGRELDFPKFKNITEIQIIGDFREFDRILSP